MPDPESLTSLKSEFLQAEIDPLGAQLFALRDRYGNDLQWCGDPSVWKGRAPILFPIVGTLAANQYRLNGDTYRLPRHGFARDRLFTLVEQTPARALFRLRWDKDTFEAYPFRFELDLAFDLEGPALSIVASVKNLETENALPASFGFHPALSWPLPYGQSRDGHAINFEMDEPAPIRRVDAEGLLLPAAFPTPVTGRKLALRDELFRNDAIIFDRIASRSLRYGAQTGPQLEVRFPDTPYLGIWTKPGAGFICIEPWHGHCDPEEFSGDFRTKPGIFLVPPGATKHCRMSIALCGPSADAPD